MAYHFRLVQHMTEVENKLNRSSRDLMSKYLIKAQVSAQNRISRVQQTMLILKERMH